MTEQANKSPQFEELPRLAVQSFVEAHDQLASQNLQWLDVGARWSSPYDINAADFRFEFWVERRSEQRLLLFRIPSDGKRRYRGELRMRLLASPETGEPYDSAVRVEAIQPAFLCSPERAATLNKMLCDILASPQGQVIGTTRWHTAVSLHAVRHAEREAILSQPDRLVWLELAGEGERTGYTLGARIADQPSGDGLYRLVPNGNPTVDLLKHKHESSFPAPGLWTGLLLEIFRSSQRRNRITFGAEPSKPAVGMVCGAFSQLADYLRTRQRQGRPPSTWKVSRFEGVMEIPLSSVEDEFVFPLEFFLSGEKLCLRFVAPDFLVESPAREILSSSAPRAGSADGLDWDSAVYWLETQDRGGALVRRGDTTLVAQLALSGGQVWNASLIADPQPSWLAVRPLFERLLAWSRVISGMPCPAGPLDSHASFQGGGPGVRPLG